MTQIMITTTSVDTAGVLAGTSGCATSMLPPKRATNEQLSGIKRLEQQAIVSVGVHLPQNGLDSAFRSDNEGGALSSKLVAFPAFRCLHPHTVRSHDDFLGITDQRER